MNTKTSKIIRRWLPAFIIMAIIFYLSSRQGTILAPTPASNIAANKLAHIFWFSALCLAFFRGVKNKVGAVALTTLYAITDEFHQSFVPTRTGQINDVFIDFAAACLVAGILWKFYPNLPKILRNWLEA